MTPRPHTGLVTLRSKSGTAPSPDSFGDAGLPRLVDGMGRRYSYARLSVTDRCDMACVYCMPPRGEDDHALRRELLSFEEISRLVSVLARSGVARVRLTGGEPLARRRIVELPGLIRARSPQTEIVMTTNGARLRTLARPLADAGLSGVNVSLDSLDPIRFRQITRGGDLSQVLDGIGAALDAGLEVKLNTVVLGGLNDSEVEEIVELAWARGITPRFIELMPLGEAARLPPDAFVPIDEVVRRLQPGLKLETPRPSPGCGPARYLTDAAGSGRRIGFIAATSHAFCDSCNRLRVTACGEVRACLANPRSVSLRDVMRQGGSDRDIAWALRYALAGKEDRHRFDEPGTTREGLREIGMSLVGG